MVQTIIAIIAGIGLSLHAMASGSSEVKALPPAETTAKDCFATIGSVLEKSGGKLTPEVRSSYLDWAEGIVLSELRQNNQAIPDNCLDEVKHDPNLADAVFGAVFPPDPSILQNYAQLRARLGRALSKKYRSLEIAMAVSKRTKGIEMLEGPISGDASTLPSGGRRDFGRDYQPDFWVDETLHPPGSDAEKQLVGLTADFMKRRQVAALDLYKNPALQKQLATFLGQKGVSSDLLAQIKESIQFGEWLKDAMVLLGQRPAARDPRPDTEMWVRHLIFIYEATPKSTPTLVSWPMFPLDSAPWPLLMPLAHTVPLTEANYIWEAFQGERGDDRFHTYGPYLGDDDAMLRMLQPSKWFWDAWPDRIVHGGECVPISKGTVDFYSALGRPAMWAGQPGHANLITFQGAVGAFSTQIEQAFAGGPDVTTAQWYFDEDPGTEIHYRDLYFWPFSEYHLGLALAMDAGLPSYMDTRIAANIYRVLPDAEKPTLGSNLLVHTLHINPFNPEIWYRLAGQTPDAMQGLYLAEAARNRDPGGVGSEPRDRVLDTFLKETHSQGVTDTSNDYWKTLQEFVTEFSILAHPAPAREAELRQVYTFLRSGPGISADQLKGYIEKFGEKGSQDVVANDVKFDRSLADHGDTYGQLRMGERYRDGVGVLADRPMATRFFDKAAAQGEPVAALELADLNPSIPAGDIAVTASSVFGKDQAVIHLVDGSGMQGEVHDNNGAAQTMWQTTERPTPMPPAGGIAPSPAWVRFDFAQPAKFDAIQIWNHNQAGQTDRGFMNARIYGSTDGVAWFPLTSPAVVELPRANGEPYQEPLDIDSSLPNRQIRSVIIAAETKGGNYGSAYYGLSAVRFVAHHS